MAAGGGETLDLLPQIQALFSDPLRVISYKWLSRNFSVSSNDAKRLLKEFVNRHGDELQVIYTVSGWSKNNPQTYRIKLASSLKLEETRQEFEGSCSVQVYSIQTCIPKDAAVLWNPEFLQAEELFNQPFDEENCLRDNRFCGVSNSFVKRTADKTAFQKHVGTCPPKPGNGISVVAQSKPSSIQKDQYGPPQQQRLVVPSSPKEGTSNKTDKDTSLIADKANKPSIVKEPALVQSNKTKGQNGKASSGNGGSLASMWGRASAKPKPVAAATESTEDIPIVAATADAQICANEATDAGSSDDEQGVNCKRDSSNASNRKRRVVFDFSDDEENEISLASPDPPKEHVRYSVSNATESMIQKDRNLDKEEDMVSNAVDNMEGRKSGFSSETDVSSGGNSDTSGISLKPKAQILLATDNKQDHIADSAPTSPKRRKILKTRIDERGREVTEVVWEGEAAAGDKDNKKMTSNDVANRTSLEKKPQAAGNSDRSNLASKTSVNKKPAKGGGKDAKQGNILSFFKKI